jgi:serine/threonine-protein kinase
MTFTPTTNDPLIGKILAERYRITELVGAGRFSIVYKGQHLFMDRCVAMKTLQSNLVEDQTIIKRFEKEAVALSKLRHPNIVSVYDCFVHTNGQPFLVMDFLDGHTLEELLNDRGAIPPKLMRAIIFQASAGLAHAHQSGVLHRDIKPDNIILLPREKTDERVRLLDFGFALLQGDMERLTLSGTLCGSPAYISPERWNGKELDARSDIYSLAVVMFQGLTGQLPFKASSLEELRNMHVSQEPPKLGDLVPSLKDDNLAHQILAIAMAKDPDLRYQTMKDFHNAIKLWAPNSDDAEIAQWAKNVGPKPTKSMQGQPAMPQNGAGAGPAAGASSAAPGGSSAPGAVGAGMPGGQSGVGQMGMPPAGAPPMGAPQTATSQAGAGQTATGQTAAGQSAVGQMAPGQAAPDQAIQQGNFTPPPGVGQSATLKPFDAATTVPNNQPKAPFDDSASLPTGDATAQQTAPVGKDAPKGYVAVDINSHPLSPEALAKIPKPNPRASLTKMDVAYIQAIAKTLGDSLGDEAKSIEITPELEEELGRAPKEETTKLDFKSMPAPSAQSTVPQPGPKVVPVVDRRQNKQSDGSSDEHDSLPASTWPAPDLNQSLNPGSKPFGTKPATPATPGALNAPAQPPRPVPAPAPTTPPTSPTTSAPAAKTPDQQLFADWSAKQAVVPERPNQPVPSDWNAKQEVPWISNPDDFKPRADFGSAGQSAAADFGAPGTAPPFTPGGVTGGPGSGTGAPGKMTGVAGGPSAQSASSGPSSGGFGAHAAAPPNAGKPDGSAAPSFGANAWAPQTGPVFGQAPPGISHVGAPDQPSQDASKVSSSRISPVLPGSPSPDAGAPGEVPWTNMSSSAPVDFGKMFNDNNTLVNNLGISASMPTGTGMPDNIGGTEVASPTASSANLSVSSEHSAPPKGAKKRGRLPTFVDKEFDAGEGTDNFDGSAPQAKKGGKGLLIAGVAVAVFIFAGIGIATWLLTNVNSNNPQSTEGTQSATAPNSDANNTNNPPANSTDSTAAPNSSDTTAATSGTTNKDATAAGITDEGTTPGVDTSTPTETAKTPAAAPKPAPPKPAPKPPVAAKAPPNPAPKKEEHSTGGWFGFPSFNQNKEEDKKAAVTANEESVKPAAPPRPKKKKKPKRAPVAHKAPAAPAGGGYVEVEVSPSRRAYRSY